MAIKTKDFRELVSLMKENAAVALPSSEVVTKSIQNIEIIQQNNLPAISDFSEKIVEELKHHSLLLKLMIAEIYTEDEQIIERLTKKQREGEVKFGRRQSDRDQDMIDYLRKIYESFTAVFTKENIEEEKRRHDELVEAIDSIKVKQTEDAEKTKRTEDVEKASPFSLGLGGTLLAASLGTIAGTITGYAKYMKALFSSGAATFDWLFKKWMPDTRKTIISGLEATSDAIQRVKVFIKGNYLATVEEIGLFFENIKRSKIGQMMQDSIKAIEKVVEEFKKTNFFVSLIEKIEAFKQTKFYTAISNIGETFTNFFKPISESLKGVEEASKPIQSLVKGFGGMIEKVRGFIGGIFDFFSGIGEKLGAFSKIFKGFATISEKLFLPVTIIMSIWDTVEGAIEGYEKGGVLGAIKGAIDGLVDSLIMAPIDLLKDIISWALDKLGFEKASKALDSFSFVDMWKSFTEWLFDLPKKLSEILEGVKIPAIGFDSPIFGKIQAGPWYPFKKDEAKKEESVDVKPSEATTETPAAPEKNQMQVTPAQAAVLATKVEGDQTIDQRTMASPEISTATSNNSNVYNIDKSAMFSSIRNAPSENLAVFESNGATPVTPMISSPMNAQTVYSGSAINAAAQAQVAPAPVTVIAPSTTNVSTNNTTLAKLPSRNNDSVLRSHYSSAYSYNS